MSNDMHLRVERAGQEIDTFELTVSGSFATGTASIRALLARTDEGAPGAHTVKMQRTTTRRRWFFGKHK